MKCASNATCATAPGPIPNPIRIHDRPTVKCSYCDREMIRRRAAFGPHVGLAKTKDHIWPYSRGGRKTIAACHTCNHAKSDMAPEVWEFFMLENPNWWLLDKKSLRTTRKLAIKMTAKIMAAAEAVATAQPFDWESQREHWRLIAKLAKEDHVVAPPHP